MASSPSSSRNIVLIGMPGVGKSTIGVLLAKAMKRPFLDTDLRIQQYADRYLQEIINTDGLPAFLDLEARVICGLHERGHVIATGGSVIYRDASMAHLGAHGVRIFLDAPLAVLQRRLRAIATRGVARQPGQTLRQLYDERRPLYLRYADHVLDTHRLSPEETVTRLLILLDSLDLEETGGG